MLFIKVVAPRFRNGYLRRLTANAKFRNLWVENFLSSVLPANIVRNKRTTHDARGGIFAIRAHYIYRRALQGAEKVLMDQLVG